MAFMWSAINAWRSAGVLAFIIFWCISCMAFMRGSMVAVGKGALALAATGDAGAAFMSPVLAHAVARVTTDKAMSVRNAVM
jgi:hypothetical protein